MQVCAEHTGLGIGMRARLAIPVVAALTLAACGSEHEDTAADASVPLAASPLGCLPFDLAEWERADYRLRTVSPVALAANDDVILAAPKLGGRLDFHYSDDGLEWAAASTPDVSLGPSEHAVAGGPQGFVAVATTGVRGAPVVVFSDDGATWERVDPAALPAAEVAWLTDVFAGPDGFLIVGTGTDGDLGLFAWFSDDGRTWTETDLAIPDEAVAVTATESGWLALTVEYPDQAPIEEGEIRTLNDNLRWIRDTAQVRLWTSSDGHRWAEAPTSTPPPGLALLSYMWTVPLMTHDDTWLLALPGAADDSPGARSPTVWVSTDTGRNWSERTVWDEPGQPGFQLYDTAVTDFGVVLTGYQDKPGQPGLEFVHHSADGISWEHCWLDPPELAAIEPFGDAIVAVSGIGDIYVWRE